MKIFLSVFVAVLLGFTLRARCCTPRNARPNQPQACDASGETACDGDPKTDDVREMLRN